jgi:hypothetical protein
MGVTNCVYPRTIVIRILSIGCCPTQALRLHHNRNAKCTTAATATGRTHVGHDVRPDRVRLGPRPRYGIFRYDLSETLGSIHCGQSYATLTWDVTSCAGDSDTLGCISISPNQ